MANVNYTQLFSWLKSTVTKTAAKNEPGTGGGSSGTTYNDSGANTAKKTSGTAEPVTYYMQKALAQAAANKAKTVSTYVAPKTYNDSGATAARAAATKTYNDSGAGQAKNTFVEPKTFLPSTNGPRRTDTSGGLGAAFMSSYLGMGGLGSAAANAGDSASGGSSGGSGGGGGGGSGGTTTTETAASAYGDLAWWGSEQLSPTLREWGTYLRELITGNPSIAISFPLTVDTAAEDAAAETGTGTSIATGGTYTVVSGDTLGAIASRNNTTVAEIVKLNPGITNPNYITIGQSIILPGSVSTTPATTVAPEAGQVSSTSVFADLQKELGLTFADTTTDAEKWQTLLNTLPKIGDNTKAQQLLTSLRYDSTNNTWYTADADQIVNTKYT